MKHTVVNQISWSVTMVLRAWARKARLLVRRRAGPGRQTHCTALHCTALQAPLRLLAAGGAALEGHPALGAGLDEGVEVHAPLPPGAGHVAQQLADRIRSDRIGSGSTRHGTRSDLQRPVPTRHEARSGPQRSCPDPTRNPIRPIKADTFTTTLGPNARNCFIFY